MSAPLTSLDDEEPLPIRRPAVAEYPYPHHSNRTSAEFSPLPLTPRSGGRARRPASPLSSILSSRLGESPLSQAYYPPSSPTELKPPTNSWMSPRLRMLVYFGTWALISLAFVIAVTVYQKQVFAGLDQLSHWLKTDLLRGYVILFSLIFITTIPPFPLYSTLIVLSSYTFGAVAGFIISYSAALFGAVFVFAVSRSFLGQRRISAFLSVSPSLHRAVRAVEKRPTLLFLIRLAPFPYNILNVLLAAAPSLTLKMYTLCTGLSLFKLLLHTSIGAGIHSFTDPAPDGNGAAFTVPRVWIVAGIVLGVGVLAYLGYVARKAVDNELDDDAEHSRDDDGIALLASRSDLESALEMGQSPFRGRLSTTVSRHGSREGSAARY